MIPFDFTYNFPQVAFLGCLLVPLFFLQWRLYQYRLWGLQQLGGWEASKNRNILRSPLIFWLKTAGLGGVWLGIVIALMGPEGNAHYVQQSTPEKNMEKQQRPQDILILVDASASMGIRDQREQTRLEYAKDIADQIISRLKRENIALQAFTSETTDLSPLTLDKIFVRLALKQIEINEGNVPGTDLLIALENAKKNYFSSPSKKLRTLILLTDGGDTLMESLERQNQKNRVEDIVNTLQEAETLNLRVFTIGLGSKNKEVIPEISYQGHPVKSWLQEGLLQKLARRGRGDYYNANSLSSVEIAEHLIREINSQELMEHPDQSRGKDKIYDSYFQIPLGIVLLVFMWILLYPDIIKYSVFFFAVLQNPLNAISPDDALFEAAQNFQAEKFDRCLEIYEDLLQSPLKPWERDTIKCNIGSVYLASHQELKAITVLSTISISSQSFPLLVRHVKSNLAIAYLYLAKETLLQSLEAFSTALFYLWEADEVIQEAKNANCALAQLEGGTSCGNSSDLEALQSQIRLAFSDTLQALPRYLIQKADTKEKVFFLHLGVHQMKQLTQLLSETNPQIKDYCKLGLSQGSKWLPLWETQEKLLTPSTPRDIFLKSKELYQACLNALANEQVKKSKEFVEQCVQTLQEFMKTIYGKDFSLKQKESDWIPLIKNPLVSTLEIIDGLVREMQKEGPGTPQALLERAIESQRRAILLGRQQGELENHMAQQQVMADIQNFNNAVIDWQRNDFQNKKRCQSQPWDEALPLFDQGYHAALQANEGDSKNRLLLQMKALNSWLEALQKIKHQVKSPYSNCPGALSSESKTSSFKETAAQLLRMEEEDRQTKPKASAFTQVERPW